MLPHPSQKSCFTNFYYANRSNLFQCKVNTYISIHQKIREYYIDSEMNISYPILSLLVFTQSNAFFTLFSNSPATNIVIPLFMPLISPSTALGSIVI